MGSSHLPMKGPSLTEALRSFEDRLRNLQFEEALPLLDWLFQLCSGKGRECLDSLFFLSTLLRKIAILNFAKDCKPWDYSRALDKLELFFPLTGPKAEFLNLCFPASINYQTKYYQNVRKELKDFLVEVDAQKLKKPSNVKYFSENYFPNFLKIEMRSFLRRHLGIEQQISPLTALNLSLFDLCSPLNANEDLSSDTSLATLSSLSSLSSDELLFSPSTSFDAGFTSPTNEGRMSRENGEGKGGSKAVLNFIPLPPGGIQFTGWKDLVKNSRSMEQEEAKENEKNGTQKWLQEEQRNIRE